MFDFKKFLREGGIEKYLLEAQFGNDIDSRYEYIRPLMSRLPGSARTEAMIDGMEEAMAEDDKSAFDFYFVETMKMLGLEDELMEPDDAMSEPDYEDYAPDSALGPNPSFVEEAESLINPEAEEIDDDDLAAASDYFDSLAENDDVLDEMIDGEVQTENKALDASGELEKTLNNVVDELTDEQIDTITNMILDLRDKVKAKKK